MKKYVLAVSLALVLLVPLGLEVQSSVGMKIVPSERHGWDDKSNDCFLSRNKPENKGMSVAGTPHDPISIEGDADFAAQALAEGWPGDGSPGNPYVIEGLDIDLGGGNGFCIHIYQTQVDFIVSNCYLTGATQSDRAAICLDRVTSAVLIDNICTNSGRGIELYLSNSNTLANNTCTNNKYGIILMDSYSNTVSDNTCSYNSYNGITVDNSDLNTIINNNCHSNNYVGIDFADSDSNTLQYNNCTSNSDGIYLWFSTDNSINWNAFADNIINGQDPMMGANDFNYNFWSDYAGTDPDGDGIGNTPYSGDGFIDYGPLVYQPFLKWTEQPMDQFIEYEQPFRYELNILYFGPLICSISDTEHFRIDEQGVVESTGLLRTYDYDLCVDVTNIYGFSITAEFRVKVYLSRAPLWQTILTNQSIACGEKLDYQITAIHPSGIDSWWINDTEHFELTAIYFYDGSTARLTNKVTLDPGVYGLEVVVTNLDGYTLSGTFSVTVLEEEVAGAISWNNPPRDQILPYNEPFEYALFVTSSAGIAGWWLSDTVNFDITVTTYASVSYCLIRNKTRLTPGEYGLLLVVTDNDGQTLMGTFRVTVDKTLLTSNLYGDVYPQIHNGMVTWMGHDGIDWEIFLYDGASVAQLTNNAFDDAYPRIHNGNVTWMGYDGNDWEIFLYDGASVIQITDNDLDHGNPKIHNGMVTWWGSDGHDVEIFLYDGTSILNISANEFDDTGYSDAGPQIDNGMVVWDRWNGTNFELLLYDGTSATTIAAPEFNFQYIPFIDAPQIDNGLVAWHQHDGNDWEVYLWDGTVHQLTNNALNEIDPQIDNGIIAWHAYDGNDNEIFLYDGTVHQFTDNDYDDYYPKLDNGTIAWYAGFGSLGADWEIFLWDGISVTRLTDNEFDDRYPEIHNGMVTWMGWDGNDWEIFLWSPEPPEPRQLELKLSGEFDFLLKEEIYFQLAALLTEVETGVPVSGATVTFDIYDPDGAILVSGLLVEDAVNPGVYIYVMPDTMKDLKLPKGIYLVYAIATMPDGAQAVDMIQFHVDPPGETLGNPFLSFAPLGLGALAIFGVSIAGFSVRRNRRMLKSAQTKGE